MSNISIRPLDRTLSGATRVELGAMALKGYSVFLKTPVTGASPSDCSVS